MTEIELMQYELTSSTLMLTRYFFKKRFGRKFVIGDHHRMICDALDRVLRGEILRLIINVAPRYSKTELCVKNFIAAGLSINPAAKFIHLSYSNDLALDNSDEIRDIVKTEDYQKIFPYVQIKSGSDSKKKWYTSAGGGVYATSAAGQVTGFGAGAVEEQKENDELLQEIQQLQESSLFAGAIIIDDPIKPDDATSERIRDRVNNRFDTTIRSRVNSRRTPIIIIMQRLHEDDLCGHIIDKEREDWTVLSLPCLFLDENGEERALWEFKDTVEELHKKKNQNEFVFETQYQQNPMPIEGLLFPKSELNFYNPQLVIFDDCEYSIFQVDPADKGDDFVGALGYVIHDDVYITDVICNNIGLDYNIPSVVELLNKTRPTVANLEGNSGWIQTCKDIKSHIEEKTDDIDVRIYKESTNKEVKIKGQAYFIKKHFWFRSDYESIPEYNNFMNRFMKYLKNGKNQKDDTCDTIASMSRFLRSNVLID